VSSDNGKIVALADGVIPDALVATVLDQVQAEKSKAKEPTEEEKLRDAVSALLKRLGAKTVQDDSLIFEGEKFILPKQYQGKVRSAIDFLENWLHQQSQTFKYSRWMKARPYDGAHAFMTVMKQITGTTGFGKTEYTMFGPKHPEFISINTGPSRVEQVPWGNVAFPMYEATFNVGYTEDDDWGIVFNLTVEAPRRWREHIQGIFNIVEEHLSKNSIYRGQAIDGSQLNPQFLDVLSLDEATVVYNEATVAQLNAHVWVPIEYSETVRSLMPLNRKVLFGGPYGTGKTLGCMLTAKKAVENGWTFLMCRTGRDDPSSVMQTAALYSPAVVVIEDIDVTAEGGTKADISRMLDSLDGVTTKGREIVCLFTTNHVSSIQRGAMRPGRIDAVIEIGALDTEAFKKLVTLNVTPEYLGKKIDWIKVAEAFDGFLPAFVKEAALRAQRFTMGRNQGRPGIIETDDLVYAAASLRPQLDLMLGANEGATKLTLDDLVREEIDGALGRTRYRGIPFDVEPHNALLKQ
jgi:transitional endoplasmic reticulum ATPase